MDKISIRGLNKAALLAALFNNSRQQGMGFMHIEGRGAMTEAEASEILKTESDFGYLRGRVMKIDIGGDDVYPGLYDRDNGQGAVQRIVDKLRIANPAGFTSGPRPDIPLTPVTSSQVKAIGYDPATKTLACQFAHGPGHLYVYPNVEPKVHADFMAAESIGKFFGQHIKALPFEKFETKVEEPAAA